MLILGSEKVHLMTHGAHLRQWRMLFPERPSMSSAGWKSFRLDRAYDNHGLGLAFWNGRIVHCERRLPLYIVPNCAVSITDLCSGTTLHANYTPGFPDGNERFVSAETKVEILAAGVMKQRGEGERILQSFPPDERDHPIAFHSPFRSSALRVVPLVPNLLREVIARLGSQRNQRFEDLGVARKRLQEGLVALSASSPGDRVMTRQLFKPPRTERVGLQSCQEPYLTCVSVDNHRGLFGKPLHLVEGERKSRVSDQKNHRDY